uniref:Protein kinase domain-containing protein n=1 Tax=Syphacia muris TaxID=451379 RepID=A0A0N5AMN5_9BILA
MIRSTAFRGLKYAFWQNARFHTILTANMMILHGFYKLFFLLLLYWCHLLKGVEGLSTDAKKFLVQLRTNYILYGITQDCRIFFTRPKYLGSISEMRVKDKETSCAPEYVKLHYYQPKDEFLLTQLFLKNALCSVIIEKPTMQTLMNTHRFDYSAYSVVQNNMYCVQLKNITFSLGSDSSFFDYYAPNVLFIANIKPEKNRWQIIPLKVTEDGRLEKHGKAGHILQESVKLEGLLPNETIVEIDAVLMKRYVTRRNSDLLLQYPLTLPHVSKIQRPKVMTIGKLDGTKARIWSFSIDNGIIIFTEINQQNSLHESTAIYGVNVNDPSKAVHLLTVKYKLELNLWNVNALRKKVQHGNQRHSQKSAKQHVVANTSNNTIPQHWHRLRPTRTTTIASTAHKERYQTVLPVVLPTETQMQMKTTTVVAEAPEFEDQQNPMDDSEEQDASKLNASIEDTGVSPAEVCDELTQGCRNDKPKIASHNYDCSLIITLLSILIALIISK